MAQIVIDYAFDVCALNELKPDQKKDLLSLLPDYKIESWGRDSHIIGDVGEGVGILYRKDKFRLLSSGHFFLSPDITKSAVAWDAKFRRLAVWAQLQDKTTGDIFFSGQGVEDLHYVSSLFYELFQLLNFCFEPCNLLGDRVGNMHLIEVVDPHAVTPHDLGGHADGR